MFLALVSRAIGLCSGRAVALAGATLFVASFNSAVVESGEYIMVQFSVPASTNGWTSEAAQS